MNGFMMARQILALGVLTIALSGKVAAQTSATDFNLPSLALQGTSSAAATSTISLQQFRGKLVYLDFWASWCAPCKRSFPWMNQMQKTYGEQGLQIIAINLDVNRDDAVSFLQSTPADFLIAYDAKGVSAQAYAVKGMPSSFLIDRNGNILHRHAGFNASSALTMEAEIKAALANSPAGALK